MRRIILLSTIALLIALCSAETTFAQQRYQPRTPTLSPQLEFFRRQTGVLPNYQQFVIPSMNLNQALQRQRSIQTQLNALQFRNNAPHVGRGGGMLPSRSAGASFQNYSHFYQFPTNASGRTR